MYRDCLATLAHGTSDHVASDLDSLLGSCEEGAGGGRGTVCYHNLGITQGLWALRKALGEEADYVVLGHKLPAKYVAWERQVCMGKASLHGKGKFAWGFFRESDTGGH